ncbi:four helix bundle protein [Niabella drilacis]|uniref:Four helix bundle protein n=1 Tax=Niabella drilacis (strain DSM 25811 / CCM 8410 / CCUG 62505 / LMG 26954 / E90) TaxID=1285928 RepID=A0A1G6IKH1_NIADE|nr:four helix bundle protein [Niabella drilacis]SDC07029.1 four helix bundle protein [Niabella drilacis]
MEIVELSKDFPKEATCSLADQIRSSRSVCTKFAEAYREKNDPAHFVSKQAGRDAENPGTLVGPGFLPEGKYIVQL